MKYKDLAITKIINALDHDVVVKFMDELRMQNNLKSISRTISMTHNPASLINFLTWDITQDGHSYWQEIYQRFNRSEPGFMSYITGPHDL